MPTIKKDFSPRVGNACFPHLPSHKLPKKSQCGVLVLCSWTSANPISIKAHFRERGKKGLEELLRATPQLAITNIFRPKHNFTCI